MIASTSTQRIAEDRDRLDRRSFLASYRALAVCTREFAQLSNEIAKGVAALHAAGLDEKPVVRLSPGRCIVQLGPVALTVAWLRSTLDAVADGELLVIVWRGAVAPHLEHHPERAAVHPKSTRRAPRAATALWQDTFVVVAERADDWAWWPERADSGGYTSQALAERCVERLRVAYEESPRAAAPTAALEPIHPRTV